MKKIDTAKSRKNLAQWFKEIPQMDKKILTLNIIKIVCFMFTFPALFIAAIVIGAKAGEGMSFYTFWPYVAAILVAVLGAVFGAVALCLNRKKSKRTIMERTAILMIVCLVLTIGLGLIFDIALPDFFVQQTFGTLFVEDLYHMGVEESRVVEDYIHLFVGLNILNGNYDENLYYETVKANPETDLRKKDIIADEDFIAYTKDNFGSITYKKEAFEGYWFGESDQYTELDHELYDFIYQHYVLMDYDYAFDNHVGRKAYCLALVDAYSETYKQLCKEGFKTNSMGAIGTTGNEKLTAIYGQNYATQDMDGYIPINEDSGIAYVTNGRMTTPMIIRMLLNDSYNYTTPIYGEDGKTVVGYDGFLAYEYRPEIAKQYTGEFDENGRGKEIFQADDGNYYYAYQTGHVDMPYNWCILDLLGEPMPLAELNLGELLGDDIGGLLDAIGGIGGILSGQSENIEELLEEGLTNRVVVTATNGQKLHLNVYITDDGAVAATLYPQGMKDGYIGYQYMAWLEMGSLLIGACAVVQTRNLLYIFGAITLVVIIAAGFIDKLIAERKVQLAEETPVNEDEEDAVVEDEEAREDELIDESIDEPVEVVADDNVELSGEMA